MIQEDLVGSFEFLVSSIREESGLQLVGTYSSVFVASPIVFAWRKEAKRVVVKREKVIELAAQKQKREEKEKKAPKAAGTKKKGGKK